MSTVDLFTDSARQVYAALADILIPAERGMPSATAAHVPDLLIDRVLEYRPDLAGAFADALAYSRFRDPGTAVEELAQRRSESFQALALLTAGAYFLSSEVRQRLNLTSGPPRPVHDDTDEYVGMLERVVERGSIYRHIDAG
ncbi:hypothetical protein ACWDO0_02800 [Nocardia rhamnosiphila]